MKALRTSGLVTSHLVIMLLLSIPVFAGQMGVSEGHDLDRLWARAEKELDPSGEDAVLLLESRHISILENGLKRARVHSVVWIGTDRGVREYADLRIPYNTASSSLKVIKLRTWRDDKWWPDEKEISSTAVVKTLPFGLTGADDYTDMREVMLLHDGVEIPCIIETVYEIEEPRGSEKGCEGLWVFPRNDPAALVEYSVSVPEEGVFNFSGGNGAPEPEMISGSGEAKTYIWRMEMTGSLGLPRISDSADYYPYVVWSTWKSWNELGKKVLSSFDSAAGLTEELTDTLAERTEYEPSSAAKALAAVELVGEKTRGIHYDSSFWFLSPRPAKRTWETAYGHSLDRAVLAAALMRKAGLNAQPVYRSKGFRPIDTGVPGLSRFKRIGLYVTGGDFQAFYEPYEGKLYEGSGKFTGRVVFEPASGELPGMRKVMCDSQTVSGLDLVLTIKPGDGGNWTGKGEYRAEGLFSPYDEMTGSGFEALNFLRNTVSSMLEGAKVSGFNPRIFTPSLVSTAFEFELESRDQDRHGRERFIIGDPEGSILNKLSSGIYLYQESRTSPVLLRGKFKQRICLRIKTGGREIVRLPKEREIDNEAGHYSLSAGNKDGWITVSRELILKVKTVSGELWPELKALLIEEEDPAGRTVMIR
ncbi:MAG: DUF3857 domain-containing protein [Candidatus Krumholzibacteriota bacterium]|nr:DUF3857 domain-containing protein [Candidatus Krumholzibacteriota bacterium]